MRCSSVSEVRTSLQQVSISLCIRIYGGPCVLPGLPVLTTAPRLSTLDLSQCLAAAKTTWVSSDVASDSSDVDVLGRL